MTISATASHDRLNSDNNDGRRLAAEGGIGTSALVITLIYLLYETMLSPPAAAETSAPGGSITIAASMLNPELTPWFRDTTLTPWHSSNQSGSENIINDLGIASLGVREKPSTAQEAAISSSPATLADSTISPFFLSNDTPSSFSPSNTPDTPAITTSAASTGVLPTTLTSPTSTNETSISDKDDTIGPRGSDSVSDEENKTGVVTSNNETGSKAGGDDNGIGGDEGEGTGGDDGNDDDGNDDDGSGIGSDGNQPIAYRLLSLVSTDPNVSATSINDAATADNSGDQVAIRNAVLVMEGSGDQIHALTERLLSSSARSLESSASVLQTLDHVGIDSSMIDFAGTGAWLNVSVSDLLTIAQEAGTTLKTTVDQDLSGIRESMISMTPFSDLIEVKSSSDIRFRGGSELNNWNQTINLESTGIKGLPNEASDNAISNLEPQHNIDLGEGTNTLIIQTQIGDNSTWIADGSEDDRGEIPSDPPQPKSHSEMSLTATAVQDYLISSGSGHDTFNLQANINPMFLENWNNEMERLNLETKLLSVEAVALRHSILESGDGNDHILLKGAVDQSSLNLGSGDDRLLINGAVHDSWIDLGQGNDVVIMVDPPELTGQLLGGPGLDTLSFKGTNQSVLLDLENNNAGGLQVDSIELAIGGSANDVLFAGDETLWMDGGDGEDLYILRSDRASTPGASPLSLALSPDDILNGDEGLMRWDVQTETYHIQQGFLLGTELIITEEQLPGTELLPIGDLSSVIQFQGISEETSGRFGSVQVSPWAIELDEHGGSGNSLIQRLESDSNSHKVIASLANNPQQDDDAAIAVG